MTPTSVVAPGPDSDAFLAGLQLGLLVLFLLIVGLVGVSIIRRMLNT